MFNTCKTRPPVLSRTKFVRVYKVSHYISEQWLGPVEDRITIITSEYKACYDTKYHVAVAGRNDLSRYVAVEKRGVKPGKFRYFTAGFHLWINLDGRVYKREESKECHPLRKITKWDPISELVTRKCFLNRGILPESRAEK